MLISEQALIFLQSVIKIPTFIIYILGRKNIEILLEWTIPGDYMDTFRQVIEGGSVKQRLI